MVARELLLQGTPKDRRVGNMRLNLGYAITFEQLEQGLSMFELDDFAMWSMWLGRFARDRHL